MRPSDEYSVLQPDEVSGMLLKYTTQSFQDFGGQARVRVQNRRLRSGYGRALRARDLLLHFQTGSGTVQSRVVALIRE